MDLVTNRYPLMGMIVDKTHTKMGKCRPYILWMTAPVILATSVLLLYICYLISCILLKTAVIFLLISRSVCSEPKYQ